MQRKTFQFYIKGVKGEEKKNCKEKGFVIVWCVFIGTVDATEPHVFTLPAGWKEKF